MLVICNIYQSLECCDIGHIMQSFQPVGFLELEQDSGTVLEKIPIYPGQEIRIGRDKAKCKPHIDNDHISKQHFRIYSVIYEQDKKSDLQPLIYCEDLGSTNGTYVNNHRIGKVGRERVGYLLSSGDVVVIRPQWKFRFHQESHSFMSRKNHEREDLERFKDEYTVSERVLGHGHYGSVFLARESSSSKQLACKIINLDTASHEMMGNIAPSGIERKWNRSLHTTKEGIKLLMREIDILSKLIHPHIVYLKKAFYSETSIYLFTELAPGGDLFSYIESHGGSLSDIQSRVISRQLVLAVKYIHSRGIAHRDIKPENVLVMQTDFGGRVVLTDFGFAKHVDQKTGRLKSRLGTEGFIAPEIQFINPLNGGYTMMADMWSLGVLTACLHTGHTLVLKNEALQLSQQQIGDGYLGKYENFTGRKWRHERPRALQFLRRLLVVNPLSRMSAAEALEHAWFTEPKTEAAMIEIGYQRVLRFWKQCNNNDKDVLEYIPSREKSNLDNSKTKCSPKCRANLPDMTLSPYFGLDRYLRKDQIKRNSKTIDDLNKSLFITPFTNEKPPRVKKLNPQKEPKTAKKISLKDNTFKTLNFGQNFESKTTLQSFQEEILTHSFPETLVPPKNSTLIESPVAQVTSIISKKHIRTKSNDTKFHEKSGSGNGNLNYHLTEECNSELESMSLKKRRICMAKD